MTEEHTKKLISIVTACYNEQGNITELHRRLTDIMQSYTNYDYEIICIDNHSIDGTRAEIRAICEQDPKFKAIFNVRNFGHIRSPWHALLQADGDAVIFLCSDLEDPPELITQMLSKWEIGFKLALAQRTNTKETGLYPYLRRVYYHLLNSVSSVDQLPGITGFGLYDKEVITVFKSLDEPYPYARGLIAELGWDIAKIPYEKPVRHKGLTKNNFMTLFDMALLAMVNHTKFPLRLSTLFGVLISLISFGVGSFYLVYKLIFWDKFVAGVAPASIGLFFLLGLLFLFLGLIGEYVGFVMIHVVRRPLVIEETRINFSDNSTNLRYNSNINHRIKTS
jgi:glycosyltransferase involved in cell wall biosynthesis